MHLGLAAWSLHRRFRAETAPLSILDYPRVAKEEFGLHAVDLTTTFFQSTELAYLDELKANAHNVGVSLWGMTVNGTGDLCAADENERREALQSCLKYFDVGKRLGLAYMRFNTGGSENPDETQIAHCTQAFRELARHGEEQGIIVCIENHGGLSKTPRPIVAVLEGVNSAYCRALPDWGNFADEIRYEGIEMLLPYACSTHAKFWGFDETGHDPRIDVGRIRNIYERVGYNGRLSIEFEGEDDSGEGIRRAKELLEHFFATT